MWRHRLVLIGALVLMSAVGCSLMTKPPTRLGAYLPEPPAEVDTRPAIPAEGLTGVLVIVNDSGFHRSAPELRRETLENLGEHLHATLHRQLPIQLDTVVYPEELKPDGSAAPFIHIAQTYNVPYLLLAVFSSTEREIFDKLYLMPRQGGGLASTGMPGYRAENYARVELALLHGQTGESVLSADGQAWAELERLKVPLESNVYPVVRRPLTQPPIYPSSEKDAHETLRWVSGQDAMAQAVLNLKKLWKKQRPT